LQSAIIGIHRETQLQYSGVIWHISAIIVDWIPIGCRVGRREWPSIHGRIRSLKSITRLTVMDLSS